MSKLIKEDCKNFSIYNLRSWKALDNNYYGGSIIWTSGYDEKKDDIRYTLNKEEKYIELNYRIKRHNSDEEWRKVNYKIPLATTSCHYGKERYWFICPLYSNGRYCGRRVAKLYLSPYCDYFACRHCLNLSYDARNKNRRGRFGYIGRFFDLEEQVAKLEEQIKIKFRAGRPTKKYLRLLNKARRLGYSADIVNGTLGKP
ncbi:MAG: hypothetical protein WCX80_00905 [Patescibacteria group bacterium]|jgi:hypothetical protein